MPSQDRDRSSPSLRWYVASPVALQGWVRHEADADAAIAAAAHRDVVLIAWGEAGAYAAQASMQIRPGEWSRGALERVLRAAIAAASAMGEVAPVDARRGLLKAQTLARAAGHQALVGAAMTAISALPAVEDRLIRGCVPMATAPEVRACAQCGALAVSYVGTIDANTMAAMPAIEERISVRCGQCQHEAPPAIAAPGDCGTCATCGTDVAYPMHDCRGE
jgi:hypothetical protein